MTGRSKPLTAGIGLLLATAGVDASAQADSRVRTSSPALAALIREGARGSPTFRGLIGAIDASDGLVYIEPGTCGVNGARACMLRLILIVNDEVGLPAQLLQDARGVAARIFQHASVDIVWVVARGATPQPPAAEETISEWEFRNARYVVRIAAGPTRCARSSALGYTVDGTRVTTVVYSRVEQQARGDRENLAIVLGHVIAHELGHLLLRRSVHSTGGLMHATLDVQRAARGVLLFTDAEEEAIRASLSASAGRR